MESAWAAELLVGRRNWSLNCCAAALADVTLLDRIEESDVLPGVTELPLVEVTPGILVPLPVARRLVKPVEANDDVGFLFPSAGTADDDLLPIGAFLTVLVEMPLFNDDRELKRLFRELLFCTAVRFEASPESESVFRNEFCLTGKFGRLAGEFVPEADGVLRMDCALLARPPDGVSDLVLGVGFALLSVLVVVMALSEEFIRLTPPLVPSLASVPELLSLPWDGVSETRLWDSSNPSSFSSMLMILFDLLVWRCK